MPVVKHLLAHLSGRFTNKNVGCEWKIESTWRATVFPAEPTSSQFNLQDRGG